MVKSIRLYRPKWKSNVVPPVEMVVCASSILALECSAAGERPLLHRLQQVPAPDSVLHAYTCFVSGSSSSPRQLFAIVRRGTVVRKKLESPCNQLGKMPLGLIVGLGRAMRRKRSSSLQIFSSRKREFPPVENSGAVKGGEGG
ncbi:hypothetical protein ACLOJK_026212 [Asimina triloba]